MKKHLLVCVFIFASFIYCETIKAQMVYIPDPVFRAKLTNLGFGSCIVNDSIDSSCPAVASEIYLDVRNSTITDLQGIQAFTSLNRLLCSGNAGLVIPALPSTLDTLMCTSCAMTSLPALPASLQAIDCTDNLLTSLPALPNLRFLACNSNQITSFPALPVSLRSLYCEDNLLTTIPTLPDTLLVLDYANNSVSVVPTLPPLLVQLDCSGNGVSVLPALPNTLVTLGCYSNILTSLPTLPPSLLHLYCYMNQLTGLPALPSGLLMVSCGRNSIISLPALPSSLEQLWCEFNQLTSLPPLPGGLVTLTCTSNMITALPQLPLTITNLRVEDNLLTSIPPLGDSLNVFNCGNNPGLYCLPQLTRISYLSFAGSPIACVPNIGTVTNSVPLLSTLPLCDLFNVNGCGFYWNISGESFFDSDSDCVQSPIEPGLSNMHIMLYQNGNLMQQVFNNSEWGYSFLVDSLFGNYDVVLDTSNLPFHIVCPATNSYTINIPNANTQSYNNDFALSCIAGFDVGVWSVHSSNVRPADNLTVRIYGGDVANFYGAHCANGVSGTVTVTITGSAQYLMPAFGALTPTSVVGNVVTYDILDFGLVNSSTDFAFIISVDSSAVSGSLICFDVSVTPVTGDNNPANNNLTYCITVVSSFDPNDKMVYPQGVIDTAQKWLSYTINFQNTGTASAINIYILDTLDNNFDLSTIQLMSTSHQGFMQVLDGGIAKFNFPNINLPDSNSNEPLSHGYVQYKIRLKDNLPIGTQIKNAAHIYFDLNAPVATNTTLNTIDIGDGISRVNSQTAVNVWPVPFDDYVFVQSGSPMTSFSVLNSFGSEIVKGKVADSTTRINTAAWLPGIYFLHVETKSGIVVRKIIKR